MSHMCLVDQYQNLTKQCVLCIIIFGFYYTLYYFISLFVLKYIRTKSYKI